MSCIIADGDDNGESLKLNKNWKIKFNNKIKNKALHTFVLYKSDYNNANDINDSNLIIINIYLVQKLYHHLNFQYQYQILVWYLKYLLHREYFLHINFQLACNYYVICLHKQVRMGFFMGSTP